MSGGAGGGKGVAGSSPCERELELRGLGGLLKATREVISVSRRLELHKLTSLLLVPAKMTSQPLIKTTDGFVSTISPGFFPLLLLLPSLSFQRPPPSPFLRFSLARSCPLSLALKKRKGGNMALPWLSSLWRFLSFHGAPFFLNAAGGSDSQVGVTLLRSGGGRRRGGGGGGGDGGSGW